MENVFIIILALLFILAISDLIVGVSNDAVNFLNSAIGSKAAPIRVILVVAAAGVLAGATFSDGMMEVARKGIFHPGSYNFKEIMIIFLAVMLTDVILLDLFNTFGLPTSTTVSIVFELLGAAVGIALIKINANNDSLAEMVNYINSAKALAIISGILLSVIVAFSVGAFVQWITRLMFSFNYSTSIKYFGGFFGGIAITAITYFILIKGLKGSSFASNIVSDLALADWSNFLAKQDWDGFKTLIKALGKAPVGSELAQWGVTLKEFNDENFQTGISNFVAWSRSQSEGLTVPLFFSHYVKYYTVHILFASFAVTGLIMQMLYSFFKVNVLKVIVIIGTFALAMAFAGNDLVNFIGVPLAGLASYTKFVAEGQDLGMTEFMMNGLAKKEQTNILFLLIAGLVMVITLWLSKKAKSVVKTTLNLSDQDSVNERFESSSIARSMVRSAINFNKGLSKVLPKRIINGVNNRFDTSTFNSTDNKEAKVSFDLVRASVNLVVASILIAIGTSLKLPLSTTYVTFMVAMGTSLADGAWDRESAVYRITGVITVIGGWFFTALSAFTVAFLVAVLLFKTFVWGVFIMAALALFVIYRTHLIHKKKEESEKEEEEKTLLSESEDANDIYDNCNNNVASLLIASSKGYENIAQALIKEKRKALKEAFKSVSKLNDESKKLKKNVPKVITQLGEEFLESGHHYVEVIDYVREAMHCLYFIAQPSYKHVDNNHKPLTMLQEESLNAVIPNLNAYIEKVVKSISNSDYTNSQEVIDMALQTSTDVTKLRKKHLKAIKKEAGSTRTNLLFLDILNETKNYILHVNNVYKAFRDFSEENKKTNVLNGF